MLSHTVEYPLDEHPRHDDRWPESAPVTELTEQHLEVLVLAVLRVVDTDAAKIAFLQIADGAPLEDGVNCINWGPTLHYGEGNPLQDHKVLCPGADEIYQAFRATFTVGSLKFDKKVLGEYQTSSPGSSVCNTRLVELVAAAIHQIAVSLWNLDQGVHKHQDIRDWRPDRTDTWFWETYPHGNPWPPFQHEWYNSWTQYPAGRADIVGYWAEWRIFGGIILFDRRESPEVNPASIYVHSGGINTTYRICLLLLDQWQSLIDFLVSEGQPKACPLPILVGDDNRGRVDPQDDLVDTGIYRDVWERAPLTLEQGDARLRHVYSGVDYPDAIGSGDSMNRAYERKNRLIREKVARDGGHIFDYM